MATLAKYTRLPTSVTMQSSQEFAKVVDRAEDQRKNTQNLLRHLGVVGNVRSEARKRSETQDNVL